LAFDLCEDELVLGHHVKCLCLENCLLVVLDEALFSDFGALALLLKLHVILASLVVEVFLLVDVGRQFLIGHLFYVDCGRLIFSTVL